ncbi:antitoxin [Mesorhizobium sp. J428]|uniref:antitoxin n=1 Tax=Mesorhizobium sp. J428 TaxID=2898440 RepID=UPI002151EA31|nr:AbrB/MazE/SpoVT family DNA-binding domain-containing protein [Mesorhizobium sp. J428]MCR5855942.1 AbrB/MazE/SpoVT family DNA-binding domain-containing protein [Mesorhizobium sp. J428]
MNAHDNKTRTASLFRNGRSQAVRIPKEFELEGDEVTISRQADGSLTISPGRKRRSPRELIDWLRQQPPLTDDEFPEIEDFPPDPVDLDLPK